MLLLRSLSLFTINIINIEKEKKKWALKILKDFEIFDI